MSMNIDEIIRYRRSHFVKEFNGDSVPDELVALMIENASWAPSHKLTMPWKLKVFKGEFKNDLCSKMETYYEQFTPQEKFSLAKLEKIRTYKHKVSHIISIGFKPSGQVPEWEELAATAMAVQNMWLTLTEHPAAVGYWTSGNGTGSEWMKDATGLDAEDKQLGFFMLGMTEHKRTAAHRNFQP
jgi:nitroreductase